MDEERVTKILEKIKETVGENNYKLALAITGHRSGKIRDVTMASKDGELLLEYVDQLEQQVQRQKEVIDKARKIINECKLLMPHEFDWEEQIDNVLDILKEVKN